MHCSFRQQGGAAGFLMISTNWREQTSHYLIWLIGVWGFKAILLHFTQWNYSLLLYYFLVVRFLHSNPPSPHPPSPPRTPYPNSPNLSAYHWHYLLTALARLSFQWLCSTGRFCQSTSYCPKSSCCPAAPNLFIDFSIWLFIPPPMGRLYRCRLVLLAQVFQLSRLCCCTV